MYPPCFAMPSCRFCLPVLSIVTTGSFCVPTAQCRLKRKGHIMKIKYAFLDGTVTEVEVSDEIGAVIIDSRKAEHAQDERHRYHCYSYDAIDYEGEEYGSCDEYAVEDDSAEQTARIREAFSHLTATQQRRLRLYANGKTLREIAAIEEASFQSVSESIEAGRKKFLKFFRQTP